MKTVNVGKKWFHQKVETVGSISDFLAPSPAASIRGGLLAAGTLTGALLTTLTTANTASAALGGAGITERIITSFNPIIDIIQGLAYPVGFITITAGALVIMTGNRQKGIHMIKWAAIGYILMMFAPGIMSILVEVGRAMAK